MLSRLNRQALSVYRQRGPVSLLPCFQQQVRNASDDDDDQPYNPFKTTVVYEEVIDTRPWRERVSTELSNDAPVYPTVFESPERDLVNFPRRVFPENPNLTRLVIIPETWFKFMYEKMGVSGPYTLGIGVFLFLAQKEIFLTHGVHWEHLCAFYMWWYTFCRTQLGNIASYAIDYDYRKGVEGCRKFEQAAQEHRVKAIENEKRQQGVAEGMKLIFDVKKENVGLQLEAAYRDSAMDLFKQVKRRLDYQVEVGKIDSRIKQQFMVNWVIEEVQKSLSKTSEADTLKQCLSDLNTLAARA